MVNETGATTGVRLLQQTSSIDIEKFYIESIVDNNIPRGSFIDATSQLPIKSNQKFLLNNELYKINHHKNKLRVDEDVEWLSPARRKYPEQNNQNLDKNSNKLEHQLGKLQQKHPLNNEREKEEEQNKLINLRPSSSSSGSSATSLEDYNNNNIQTQVQHEKQQKTHDKILLEVDSLHKVDDDDNNNNNNENNDNDDDCDNNNNNKSGDSKTVNVWKQDELFQAGNIVSKNWSLTVQELVLDTEFEHQPEDAEVLNEQREHSGDDNVVNVYFRLLYRRVGKERIVFEQIFKRQLQKDCIVKLKRLNGDVDQTSLPYRYQKCTVVFPTLFNELSNNNKNREIPLPGLLVQLTRLNIPCNSAMIKARKFAEN
uniref:CSON003570 protein n=1 Tax=Culicoides sonorensis TaxID=179676 RepID=A0A336MRE4_CULSO